MLTPRRIFVSANHVSQQSLRDFVVKDRSCPLYALSIYFITHKRSWLTDILCRKKPNSLLQRLYPVLNPFLDSADSMQACWESEQG